MQIGLKAGQIGFSMEILPGAVCNNAHELVIITTLCWIPWHFEGLIGVFGGDLE